MEEGVLDVALVPAGVLLLLLYHAHLLYRVRVRPASTVMGVNQLNRQLWVRTIMEDGLKNGILAVQTLRNNIMASTLLATTAITLCSVLGVLVSYNGSVNHQEINLLLGDKGSTTTSTKLMCVLVCFLATFLCNAQSVRYYTYVSFLVSIPPNPDGPGLKLDYVDKAMLRGSQFWSLGLRSFYFSFPMFMWLFGPIPMFVSSFIVTIMLHFLDTTKEFKKTFTVGSEDQVDTESNALS